MVLRTFKSGWSALCVLAMWLLTGNNFETADSFRAKRYFISYPHYNLIQHCGTATQTKFKVLIGWKMISKKSSLRWSNCEYLHEFAPEKRLLNWNQKIHFSQTTTSRLHSFLSLLKKKCIESIWTRKIASDFVPFTWIMVSIADTLDIGLSCWFDWNEDPFAFMQHTQLCLSVNTQKRRVKTNDGVTRKWLLCESNARTHTYTHIATADFSLSGMLLLLLLLLFLFHFASSSIDQTKEMHANSYTATLYESAKM